MAKVIHCIACAYMLCGLSAKLSAQHFSMILGCPQTHRIFMMWLASHMCNKYLPPTCKSLPNKKSNAVTTLAQADISSASLLVNVAALKCSAERQRVRAGRFFHAIVPPAVPAHGKRARDEGLQTNAAGKAQPSLCMTRRFRASSKSAFAQGVVRNACGKRSDCGGNRAQCI